MKGPDRVSAKLIPFPANIVRHSVRPVAASRQSMTSSASTLYLPSHRSQSRGSRFFMPTTTLGADDVPKALGSRAYSTLATTLCTPLSCGMGMTLDRNGVPSSVSVTLPLQMPFLLRMSIL